jgi:hypothetical protein
MVNLPDFRRIFFGLPIFRLTHLGKKLLPMPLYHCQFHPGQLNVVSGSIERCSTLNGVCICVTCFGSKLIHLLLCTHSVRCACLQLAGKNLPLLSFFQRRLCLF